MVCPIVGGGTPEIPEVFPPVPSSYTSSVPPADIRATTFVQSIDAAPTIVSKPTGTIQDDILFNFMRWENITDTIIGSPAGWTRLGTSMVGVAETFEVWYKVMGDEMATTTYAWTLSGIVLWNIQAVTVRNASPTDVPIFGQTVGGGASTSVTAPSITTTRDNSLMLGFFASASLAITFTPPADMIEGSDASGMEVTYSTQSLAGVSGAKVATGSASDTWVAALIALGPSRGMRLYMDPLLDATGRPTPGPAAVWDQTAGRLERLFRFQRGAAAGPGDLAVSETSTTSLFDAPIVRYWLQLGAGSVSGAIVGQANTKRDAGDQAISQISAEVFTKEGALIGTIYPGHNSSTPTNDWAIGSFENRRFPRLADSRALATIGAGLGNWLAVTLGYRTLGTATTSQNQTIRAQVTGSDLPEDDAFVGDKSSWIQITREVPGYGSPAPVAPVTLLTGLGAYYTLNESGGTRADSLGVANLTDSSTVGAAAGKIGNGAVFVSASTDILTRTGGSPGLEFDNFNAPIHIAFWWNPSAVGATQVIMQKGGAAIEWRMNQDAAGVLSAQIGGLSSTFAVASTAGAVVAGTWYFVQVWRNPLTVTIHISVNNGADDVATCDVTSRAAQGDFYIGNSPLLPGTYADGTVDELGVWQRLLTANERTTLYNSGAGRTYPF